MAALSHLSLLLFALKMFYVKYFDRRKKDISFCKYIFIVEILFAGVFCNLKQCVAEGHSLLSMYSATQSDLYFHIN